jgi:caa(3)-type oxidase subunit IV
MADHAHAKTSSRKPYLVIFIVLLVLTLLEVGVATLPMAKVTVGTLLVLMALGKAALVAFFFMHLNHERKALQYMVMLPFLFPALYAFVLIVEAGWRLIRP